MTNTRRNTGTANVGPTDPAAAVAEPRPAKVAPFLSEGTRHDLEFYGKATDPVSGAVFVLDRETGEVTVTEREPANE